VSPSPALEAQRTGLVIRPSRENLEPVREASLQGSILPVPPQSGQNTVETILYIRLYAGFGSMR